MSRPEVRTQRRTIRPLSYESWKRIQERRDRVKHLALIASVAIPATTFFFATSDEYTSHPYYGAGTTVAATVSVMAMILNISKLRRKSSEYRNAVENQMSKRQPQHVRVQYPPLRVVRNTPVEEPKAS